MNRRFSSVDIRRLLLTSNSQDRDLRSRASDPCAAVDCGKHQLLYDICSFVRFASTYRLRVYIA